MKYSFNHAGPYVEIPALDSFLHEFRNICKKYSMGYRLEHCADDGFSSLQIVHVDRCDWDMFLECLADYDEGGVPFLDEAKSRWKMAIAKQETADAKRREEQKAKAEAEEQMRKVRREEDMRRNGVSLSDGVYKLVKEEGPSDA